MPFKLLYQSDLITLSDNLAFSTDKYILGFMYMLFKLCFDTFFGKSFEILLDTYLLFNAIIECCFNIDLKKKENWLLLAEPVVVRRIKIYRTVVYCYSE